MFLNARNGKQLTSLDFWQLVDVLANFDKTKEFVFEIKECLANMAEQDKALNAKMLELSDKDKFLNKKANDLSTKEVELNSAQARFRELDVARDAHWTNITAKADVAYNEYQDAKAAYEGKLSGFEQVKAEYAALVEKTNDGFMKKAEELNNREVALAAKEAAYQEKLNSLSAALKNVKA